MDLGVGGSGVIGRKLSGLGGEKGEVGNGIPDWKQESVLFLAGAGRFIHTVRRIGTQERRFSKPSDRKHA